MALCWFLYIILKNVDNLDIEQIKLLIDLFKWLMAGFAGFLLLLARIFWYIYKNISNIENKNTTRDEKIKNLEINHHELKQYVYRKN